MARFWQFGGRHAVNRRRGEGAHSRCREPKNASWTQLIVALRLPHVASITGPRRRLKSLPGLMFRMSLA